MKKLVYLLTAALAACTGGVSDSGTGTTGDDTTNPGIDAGTVDNFQQILGSRTVDYSAALRIAALRLTGDLPKLSEVQAITDAADDAAKKAAYVAAITDYMGRPSFALMMQNFWRDTFKMGGTAVLDTAPTFAAQLSVQNGNYLDLFTATTGTCPTMSADGTTFTPANCTNGGPVAGVLTNPGVMAQFASNFAFRRVRWIQEMFDCTAMPAEVAATPVDVGGAAPYTGTWPFQSISGTPTGRVNFLDVSAVVCADCHSTMNHRAPLFAHYDAMGKFQTAIVAPTPLDGAPPAQLTDYLPATETTGWKFGQSTADIPAFGAAMAADPEIATCGVARMWNWALGKTDIVDALELVPATTIQDQVAAFKAGGYKLKDLIFAVYTSDDFTKF